MKEVSPEGRLALRYFADVLFLKTNGWCEAPDDMVEGASELEKLQYLERYNSGFRLTNDGIVYLLTTKSQAPDEIHFENELAKQGFSDLQIRDILLQEQKISEELLDTPKT